MIGWRDGLPQCVMIRHALYRARWEAGDAGVAGDDTAGLEPASEAWLGRRQVACCRGEIGGTGDGMWCVTVTDVSVT